MYKSQLVTQKIMLDKNTKQIIEQDDITLNNNGKIRHYHINRVYPKRKSKNHTQKHVHFMDTPDKSLPISNKIDRMPTPFMPREIVSDITFMNLRKPVLQPHPYTKRRMHKKRKYHLRKSVKAKTPEPEKEKQRNKTLKANTESKKGK